MAKLIKRDREQIIELLEKGEDLPLDYKHILFPPEKKEYELVYAGKEREEDILADTMAVPLQPIKNFGKNGDDWTNKLIFGDNLQVMKSLLDDPDVKGRVKLIYIDPPFATKQEFKGSRDQKAYQDKIAGANFLEFLRKRLLFLKEILADDGLFYIHLDQKKGHYIKVIMDEIFGESYFLNEVVWKYVKFQMRDMNRFAKNSDRLLLYSKTPDYYFHPITYKLDEPKRLLKKGWDKELGKIQNIKDAHGKTQKITIYDEKVDDVWNLSYIGATSKERLDYPTQKPEKVLDWVIKSSTVKGDLVLDAFAGSGTSLAVAEKLGRRWIGIDCGKLAIYTMQKRMLNLKSKIGSKGKYKMFSIDEIAEQLQNRFKSIDMETAETENPTNYSDKYNLQWLKKLITNSLHRIGEKGNQVSDENRQRIYQGFGVIHRPAAKAVRYKMSPKALIEIHTRDRNRNSVGFASIKRAEATIFWDDLSKKLSDEESINFLNEIDEDETLPRSAMEKIDNTYNFKTPLNIVIADHKPERLFVRELIKHENSKVVDSWLKSTDQDFYPIEYAWRKGEHPKRSRFNPDFFIKVSDNILVVEIKGDEEIREPSDENRAKYKSAKKHFDTLNEQQSKLKYYFNFLTPEDYDYYFDHLGKSNLNFNSKLDAELV